MLLNCGGNSCALYYDGNVSCNGGAGGNYHIEMINNVANCVENTRACSAFDIDVAFGEWTCSKSSQTGNAVWNSAENAWDTYACKCSVADKDIGMDAANSPVNCKEANALYNVAAADRYRTIRMDGSVYYTPERVYCARCYPGYLPVIDVSPDSYGVYLRPAGNGGNWGARVCTQEVQRPYYADGCVIDFSKSTGQAAIETPICRKSCPPGHETNVNGATSASQCISAGNVYEDATGTFTLGTVLCQ